MVDDGTFGSAKEMDGGWTACAEQEVGHHGG